MHNTIFSCRFSRRLSSRYITTYITDATDIRVGNVIEGDCASTGHLLSIRPILRIITNGQKRVPIAKDKIGQSYENLRSENIRHVLMESARDASTHQIPACQPGTRSVCHRRRECTAFCRHERVPSVWRGSSNSGGHRSNRANMYRQALLPDMRSGSLIILAGIMNSRQQMRGMTE